MRETRPSGSEGGGTGPTGPPYPYQGDDRTGPHRMFLSEP